MACLLLVALWWMFGGRRADAPRVRVGVLDSPACAPLALAREHGALDGARALLVEFESGEDLRNAFLDGNVHVAILPLDDALRFAGPPQEARLLGFVAMSRESLALVTLPGGPSLAGLRGRRVGLESGPLGVAALSDMFAPEGFGPRELDLRLVDVDSAEPLLRSRDVDAVLVSGKEGAHLLTTGGVELARWLPAPEGVPLVLVASARAVKLAPRPLAYVVAAWDSGAAQLERRDPRDLERIARSEGLAVADLPGALDRIEFLPPGAFQRVRTDAGRAELAARLEATERRWRRAGLEDSLPSPYTWVAALTGVRP